MVAPAVEGIDLFKIADRSISVWISSFKTSAGSPVRQPFCSQLKERLLLWLDYHPQVASYARGDIGQEFATTYRLPIPKHPPFAIGYTFEGKPHEYLPDVVGNLMNGKLFTAKAGMEDDFAAEGHLLIDLERFTLDRTLPLARLSPDAAPLVPESLPDTLLPEPPREVAPASIELSAPVPGPTFDASRLSEKQREQFHRNLRAVEQVLAGLPQTRIVAESGIPRSTLGRLVWRTRELGQIACVPIPPESWPTRRRC